MFWSTFIEYFTRNQNNVPAAFAAQIKREAIARYKERMQSGYADSALCFRDLIAQMEAKIAAP